MSQPGLFFDSFGGIPEVLLRAPRVVPARRFGGLADVVYAAAGSG